MHEARPISFHREMYVTEGTKRDWPYFARWHYRSHALGPVRRVTVLWHGEQPVGICVFGCPATQLRLRNQLFDLLPIQRAIPRRAYLRWLNRWLWLLSRVVIHPTYRGAGLASAFVRKSCATCPVPFVETLASLGHVHPLFERAGFRRVGVCTRPRRSRSPAGLYSSRGLTPETTRKSAGVPPVYYVWGRELDPDCDLP